MRKPKFDHYIKRKKVRKINRLNKKFSTKPILLIVIVKIKIAPGNKQFDAATITDKIFGTKWNNPVTLDRRRKLW